MLFYELVVDPDALAKEFIVSNRTEFIYLRLILKNVIEQGTIVSIDSNPWIDFVQHHIETLNDKDVDEALMKKQLQEFLITLKSKQKVVNYTLGNLSHSWLEAMAQLDPYMPFFATVGIKSSDQVFTPETLFESQKWTREISKSTKYAKQDNEYIESEIKPVVYNAKLLEIIDPYFNILEARYSETLSIIAETLKHNIINCQPTVIIHIKNSRDKKIDIADDIEYLKHWQDEFKKYTFALELQVWKETSKEKMHDRHIVRDESFCITLPAGIDKRLQNKSTWHVEPDYNIDEILNDHREDSSPYELVASVTSSEIKIWVKGVLKKNVHLSIEEKLKNVKTLKPSLVPKTT